MAGSGTTPRLSTSLPSFLQQSKNEIHAKFVDLEWLQRNRLLQSTQTGPTGQEEPSPWARLRGRNITARNRYTDVGPFANNRVRLRVSDGVNDYINASPIRLGKRRYIATQGPIDTSLNHFYRMVVSEVGDPAVVVMLTRTHEAGKEKCLQYYPLSTDAPTLQIPSDEEMDDDFHGEVRLQSVEYSKKVRSEIRRMQLQTTTKGEQSTKNIIHLLFSGWPDFLVPEGDDRAALVDLVRLSASINKTPSQGQHSTNSESSMSADLASTSPDNPRIIHCSAGVGRSGTFIALDYLLSLMVAGELDDLPAERDPIEETVNSLRQQRMMMVQGESQFFFLYEIMQEMMTARLASTK